MSPLNVKLEAWLEDVAYLYASNYPSALNLTSTLYN